MLGFLACLFHPFPSTSTSSSSDPPCSTGPQHTSTTQMRFRAQTLLAHSLSGPISCTLIPPHQSLPTYPIVLCYVSVLSHQSLAPSLSFFPSFVPRPVSIPVPMPQIPINNSQYPTPGLHSLDSWTEWVGFPSCVCNSNVSSRSYFHFHSLSLSPHRAIILYASASASVSVPAPVSVCTCIDPISSHPPNSVQFMHVLVAFPLASVTTFTFLLLLR